jgi:hypothetical protein
MNTATEVFESHGLLEVIILWAVLCFGGMVILNGPCCRWNPFRQ